jgi:hypothetical protein
MKINVGALTIRGDDGEAQREKLPFISVYSL